MSGEVATDEKTLRLYSADASVFRIKPQVVVYPKSAEDIKALVKFTAARRKSAKNISLTVRSAGTDMTGGPLNDSIILDLNRHFQKIDRVGRDFVECAPGVFYRNLEKDTLKHHNLIFPSYPASKAYASVGGIVANNAGGEMTLRYGKTEDYVRELKVILADGQEYLFKKLNFAALKKKLSQRDFEGQIYRATYKLITANHKLIEAARPKVTKNSTGYLLWKIWDPKKKTFDLSKIFVGAQGTLGIITHIRLGLVKLERHSKMFVVYLKDFDRLGEVTEKILEYKPTALELYDDKTLALALKFAPQLALMIGRETNLLKFGLSLAPDFWIMLKMRRLPKLVLLAEFRANEEVTIDTKLTELKARLKAFPVAVHIPKSADEAEKYWVIRRQSFNLLRKKIKDKQTVPFIDDLIVPVAALPEFLPKLNAILEEYPSLIETVAGHAGDGNLHVIPLMDLSDPKQRALIPEVAERVYDLTLKYGGSLSAEHNDGLIRGPYLEKMYGPAVMKLFWQVKKIFDLQNIFNPHKKTDATMSYLLTHLKTDNEHSV